MHLLKFPLMALLCLSSGAAFAQSAPPKAPAAATTPAKRSAFDKSTLENYIRHLFVWGPQVNVAVSEPKPAAALPGYLEVSVTGSAGQASQAETFYISKDGQKIVRGAVYDVGENPFQSEIEKLKTDLQPSMGTPGAPVVMVVFSDFECGYCREQAKIIRENLLKTYPTEVRLYFKDFPLEQIHPWAKPAAIAGRCVFRQNPSAFWDFHDWAFEKQGEIKAENLKEKVLEFAKSKNLEPIQLTACMEDKTTAPEVEKNLAEGRSLAVNSTPTLFVNGRRLVGNYAWPQLKQILDAEIEYQKTAGGGEKCCEVKLPSPLNK